MEEKGLTEFTVLEVLGQGTLTVSQHGRETKSCVYQSCVKGSSKCDDRSEQCIHLVGLHQFSCRAAPTM